MGRGLSELQKEVLTRLAGFKDKSGRKWWDWFGGTPCEKTIPAGKMHFLELGHAINGKYASPSKRAALSRAISRLHDRELIQLYADGVHEPNRFVKELRGAYQWIDITDRGLAYLKGEKLPPLEPVKLPEPGRCFCGKDISMIKGRDSLKGQANVHPLPSTRQQLAGISKWFYR